MLSITAGSARETMRRLDGLENRLSAEGRHHVTLEDYHDLVKTPMDLGTIKSRLASFQYSDVSSFASDVRLVFENATTSPPER